jgi:hypothetical protein
MTRETFASVTIGREAGVPSEPGDDQKLETFPPFARDPPQQRRLSQRIRSFPSVGNTWCQRKLQLQRVEKIVTHAKFWLISDGARVRCCCCIVVASCNARVTPVLIKTS